MRCVLSFLALSLVFLAHTADAVDIALPPGAIFQDCTDCPLMVVISAGSNIMGSTKEETDREGVPVIGKMDIASWELCRCGRL